MRIPAPTARHPTKAQNPQPKRAWGRLGSLGFAGFQPSENKSKPSMEVHTLILPVGRQRKENH